MGQNCHKQTTLFALLLFTLAPMLFIMYTPYLPILTRQLGTSNTAMQLSLTFYLVSYALSHLVYGPLAQKIGWHKMLLVGMVLLFTGSLLPLLMKNIIAFNLCRFMQGFGAGAASTTALFFIGCHYQGRQVVHRMGYLAAAFAVGTLLAPLLGVYLVAWENCFVFMTLASAIVYLGTTLFVKEMNLPKEDISIFEPLKDKPFITFILCGSFIFSIPAILISMYPYVFFDLLHLLPESYAALIVLMILGYLLGSIVGSHLAVRFGINEVITLALIIVVGMSAAGLLLASLQLVTINTITIPIVLVMIGSGMAFANTLSGALLHFQRSPIMASCLINFLFSSIAALMTVAAAYLREYNHVPITGMMLVCALVAVMIFWLLAPKDQRHISL